jgi:AcrR family transcriptional regulator
MSDPARRTKDLIRDAAFRLFADAGYAGTSVRDIAAAAGVDPALVIRHFGSKQTLFLEAMDVETLPLHPAIEGPLEGLGERCVRAILEGDAPDARGVYLALVRASDAGDVHSRLHAANEEFVAALAALIGGRDPEIRARAGAAVIGGFLYSLWIVGDQRLDAEPRDALARRFGALLQAAIDPE